MAKNQSRRSSVKEERGVHNPEGAGATPAAATTDWERIEPIYRAGILSLREVAQIGGVSHVSLMKHAKKFGWERDLTAKIHAKAEALVTKQAVTTAVTSERAVTERDVIDANAARIAEVRGSHRTDITRARTLSMRLLEELEAQTGNPELFQQLFDLVNPAEGENDAGRERASKLQDAFQRTLSLTGRTKTLKDLGDTLKTLIGLEREAYGLDKVAQEDPGAKEAVPLHELARRAAFLFTVGAKAANDSAVPQPRQAAS